MILLICSCVRTNLSTYFWACALPLSFDLRYFLTLSRGDEIMLTKGLGSTMPKLYYYPKNASLVAHFVLEELEIDFELVLVDRKTNAHKSADYLSLNPTGRIPALVDGDLVLFESAAICLYLCEQYSDSALLPRGSCTERALFFQWLLYLTSTVQSEMMLYFYPEKHTNAEGNVGGIAAVQEQRITAMFALLDETLASRQFLVGSDLSVCDLFLLMLSFWADDFSRPPLSFQNLRRYLRSLVLRPALRKVCENEGISLDAYR